MCAASCTAPKIPHSTDFIGRLLLSLHQKLCSIQIYMSPSVPSSTDENLKHKISKLVVERTTFHKKFTSFHILYSIQKATGICVAGWFCHSSLQDGLFGLVRWNAVNYTNSCSFSAGKRRVSAELLVWRSCMHVGSLKLQGAEWSFCHHRWTGRVRGACEKPQAV